MTNNNKIVDILSLYKDIGIELVLEDINQVIGQFSQDQDSIIHDVLSTISVEVVGTKITEALDQKELIAGSREFLQLQQDLANIESLEELNSYIRQCDLCMLSKTAMYALLGEGSGKIKTFAIGGVPSNLEDESGKTLSGIEGILLKKALNSVRILGKDTFLTHSVFWRPPGNREPKLEEMLICYEIIKKMIVILEPDFLIVADENIRELFFPKKKSIGMIGKWIEIEVESLKKRHSVLARVVYSAKYLINNPFKKKDMWMDLIEVSNKVNSLENIKSLEELEKKLLALDNVNIKEKASNTVFGFGDRNADIILIGEAPGQMEDEMGLPFVGRSGMLLDKVLGQVGAKRDNMFITNTVFWRPENNRNPTVNEIEICYPFLKQIIALINPKIIVFLGRVATTKFYAKNSTMSSIRGKWQSISFNENQDVLATVVYHPSYVLRGQPTRLPVFEQDFINIIEKAQDMKLKY